MIARTYDRPVGEALDSIFCFWCFGFGKWIEGGRESNACAKNAHSLKVDNHLIGHSREMLESR